MGWKQKFQRKKGFTILTSVWFSPFWQYSCKPYSGKQQAEIMYIKDSKCNTRELLQKMSMFVQLFVRAKHDNDLTSFMSIISLAVVHICESDLFYSCLLVRNEYSLVIGKDLTMKFSASNATTLVIIYLHSTVGCFRKRCPTE